MSDKFIRRLQKLIAADQVIEVDRSPVTKWRMQGFPVMANSRFVLLHLLDDSYFLNGFSVVRTDTIRRFRVVEDRGDLIRYVLSQRYPEGYVGRPLFEAGELEDFSFLERVHDGYPIVTVHREKIDDTVCAIGRVVRLKRKKFFLRTMDIDASWDDVRKFRHRDVTRIDFGGAYEAALWMYAQRGEGTKPTESVPEIR